jgi:intracellular sulfur oxidation DsrE/DsrF family protein
LNEDAATTPPRVVVHLDEGEPSKHASVLRNLHNLREELDGCEIELVVHGLGIGAVRKDSPHATELGAAITAGTRVVACRNTMRALAVQPDDLTTGVETVPSGVAELVRRQTQGWVYIRP